MYAIRTRRASTGRRSENVKMPGDSADRPSHRSVLAAPWVTEGGGCQPNRVMAVGAVAAGHVDVLLGYVPPQVQGSQEVRREPEEKRASRVTTTSATGRRCSRRRRRAVVCRGCLRCGTARSAASSSRDVSGLSAAGLGARTRGTGCIRTRTRRREPARLGGGANGDGRVLK